MKDVTKVLLVFCVLLFWLVVIPVLLVSWFPEVNLGLLFAKYIFANLVVIGLGLISSCIVDEFFD